MSNVYHVKLCQFHYRQKRIPEMLGNLYGTNLANAGNALKRYIEIPGREILLERRVGHKESLLSGSIGSSCSR